MAECNQTRTCHLPTNAKVNTSNMDHPAEEAAEKATGTHGEDADDKVK